MTRVVAIANDHAGLALKKALIPVLRGLGCTVEDLGTGCDAAVDYPDYGRTLGEAVAADPAKTGIAICGSGIGISIAANRIAGARAALCCDATMATLARQHNDANILALGARLLSTEQAEPIVRAFLTTAFEGGRHAARVAKLA